MASEPIKHLDTGRPVCPACGRQDDCWWECGDLKNDGDCTTQECGKCGATYDVQMFVEVSFCTALRQPAGKGEG